MIMMMMIYMRGFWRASYEELHLADCRFEFRSARQKSSAPSSDFARILDRNMSRRIKQQHFEFIVVRTLIS
jgi:hypothetical protein